MENIHAKIRALSYGAIIADPPWDYAPTSRHRKLSGYSEGQYKPITTQDLCNLPVGNLANDDSVLFLWTAWPFIKDALQVLDAWGFDFVTGLPWVKVDSKEQLTYGVGYWFRGCTEPILVGKRKRAYRSNLSGIISQELGHSRKPEHIHELVERGGFPQPYLELFGRQERQGWTVVGDECPSTKGEDIRVSVNRLAGIPQERRRRLIRLQE